MGKNINEVGISSSFEDTDYLLISVDNALRRVSVRNLLNMLASGELAIVKVDATLKNSGEAADAKVVGEAIAGLQTKITCGTEEPTGGSDGDIYIQIIE